MARSWPGGDNRRSGRASHHEAWEARESFLLPWVATGVSLLAVWCLSGATPRGPPWTSAVTLPQGRNGLNARPMGVLSTCHEPSLCRHVHRTLLRSVWLDVTPRISETACHQRNDVERYRRYSIGDGKNGGGSQRTEMTMLSGVMALGVVAATPKFEAKRRGASHHSYDSTPVSLGGYSASKFEGSA